MPNPDAPACRCGSLERLAKEPTVPVVFDPELNEYHIRGEGEGGRTISVMIYHCPFCGGRAPKSRRHQLFMHITDAESERLKGIVRNLKSLSEVLAALGPPDYDEPGGSGTTTSKKGRDSIEVYRQLRYSGLSTMADVLVIVHPSDKVGFTFIAKPIESRKSHRPRRSPGTRRKRRVRPSA